MPTGETEKNTKEADAIGREAQKRTSTRWKGRVYGWVKYKMLVACDFCCLEENTPLWVQESVSWGWLQNHCTKMLPFRQCSRWSSTDNLKQDVYETVGRGPRGQRLKKRGRGWTFYLQEELRVPASWAVHFFSFANFRWDPVGCHSPKGKTGYQARSLRCGASGAVKRCWGRRMPQFSPGGGGDRKPRIWADCTWGQIVLSKSKFIYFSLGFPLPALSFFWNTRS